MTDPSSLIRAASALFARRKLPWALVGGWAISARAEPRFTRDIDLAVAVANDALAQELAQDFRGGGFAIQALVEQDATERLATVRLESSKQPGVLLDLLFASSGIEEEVCRNAEPLELLPGVIVPVARPEHLLALKILSRNDRTRPQDAADIRALLATMDQAMQAKTREALDLITQRGYHRERPLRILLQEAITVFGDTTG